jgi:hypothetical protein
VALAGQLEPHLDMAQGGFLSLLMEGAVAPQCHHVAFMKNCALVGDRFVGVVLEQNVEQGRREFQDLAALEN